MGHALQRCCCCRNEYTGPPHAFRRTLQPIQPRRPPDTFDLWSLGRPSRKQDAAPYGQRPGTNGLRQPFFAGWSSPQVAPGPGSSKRQAAAVRTASKQQQIAQSTPNSSLRRSLSVDGRTRKTSDDAAHGLKQWSWPERKRLSRCPAIDERHLSVGLLDRARCEHVDSSGADSPSSTAASKCQLLIFHIGSKGFFEQLLCVATFLRRPGDWQRVGRPECRFWPRSVAEFTRTSLPTSGAFAVGQQQPSTWRNSHAASARRALCSGSSGCGRSTASQGGCREWRHARRQLLRADTFRRQSELCNPVARSQRLVQVSRQHRSRRHRTQPRRQIPRLRHGLVRNQGRGCAGSAYVPRVRSQRADAQSPFRSICPHGSTSPRGAGPCQSRRLYQRIQCSSAAKQRRWRFRRQQNGRRFRSAALAIARSSRSNEPATDAAGPSYDANAGADATRGPFLLATWHTLYESSLEPSQSFFGSDAAWLDFAVKWHSATHA